MENFSLLALVFVLGLRHGLDADHLASIDGLTRYNLRQGRKTARWVGTLFSFGHGLIVATVGVILSMISKDFTFPDYFDTVVTWVSVCSLALIGCLNTVNLLRSRSEQGDFALRGIKGRFIPRVARETTNPVMIIVIGGVFALAADTVSQTSVWALASGNAHSNYLPFVLGLTFMAGMMLTDTIDSLVAYRMLAQSGKFGRTASRAMGWLIVALAFGVSFYEAFTFFNPWAELDFEVVGVVIFILLLLSFGGVWFLSRHQKSQTAA
ncbi:sodium:proton antiporter [Tumebacillus flagellatus]|uniref:Nickel/cobalt efflux system n=1 Tax=Tumebacillus flagellatus TaxID=1157490 RepID=A0A074MEB1_9BACL|nr:sodium:proton antiporter [Tumebacillus flagellatus]KEO84122.1 sodium:proton antiporter [Tumebacillus flagellatus]